MLRVNLLACSLRRTLLGGLGLGAFLHAPTLAAKGQVELPPQCGSYAELASQLRVRLGQDADAVLDALELRIRQEGTQYSLFLRLGDKTRRLEDPICTDLFVAAVVVAVTLWEAPSPAEAAEPEVMVGKPEATATVSPLPTNRRSGNPSAPTRASASGHWSLGGEIGIAGGLLPKPDAVFGLRGAVDWKHFGLASALQFLPPRGSRDENGRGVEITAVGGNAAGSAKPWSGLALELGVSGYCLRGTGLGSQSNRSATLASFAPFVGLRAIPWQTGRVFLSVAAEGRLELLRPRFEVLEYKEVFRVSALTWAAHVGAGYRFF